MNLSLSKIIMSSCLLVAAFSSQSFAAAQGGVGTTSTGSLNINVTKLNQVKISNLQDINFGAQASSPSKTSQDVCIYSTSGSYDITASSANANGSTFRLASGSNSSTIMYVVEWKDSNSGTSGNNLQSGITSNKFNNANQNSQNCNGSNNARLFVELNQGNFTGAPAGTYSDVLTLVVSPQ